MRTVTLSLALMSLLASQAGESITVHTYLIPAKMRPGWITIEYGNSKCPPLKESGLRRELAIPESGFLCTSSSSYQGWRREEYYLVGEHNRRTALETDRWIHRRGSFRTREVSSVSDTSHCDVSGEQFFFGPIEELKSENPIMSDENFLKLHPECRKIARQWRSFYQEEALTNPNNPSAAGRADLMHQALWLLKDKQ